MEVSCVEELWDAYQNRLEESGYTFLVYRDEANHAAGYACFGPHPLTQGSYDLYWIVVEPLARGQGFGHALLLQVEAEVRDLGGRLLLIETSATPGYDSARRFYESSGYRLEALIHDFYSPGDHLLVFAKHLQESHPIHEGSQTVVGASKQTIPFPPT